MNARKRERSPYEGEFWVLNTPNKLAHFLRFVQGAFAEHKYLDVQLKTGKRRSRSQEALWAIWARDYIAPFMDWTEEQARDAMYHLFLGYEDRRISQKLTIGHQLKRLPRSQAEVFAFMTAVQGFWANHNPPLLLESSGDYLRHQQEGDLA